MSIALLVITDGREEYLRRTVASAEANLLPSEEIAERWMFDDTGDDDYRADLANEFPRFRVFGCGGRRGFGGAIRAAWASLRLHSKAEYVFHLECDFTFNRAVNLDDMQDLLGIRPNLAQVALRRQPWNDEEHRAGGIVEQHPESYEETRFFNLAWLEHSRFFTTNPCMYRRELMSLRWPEGAQSEGMFGLALKASGMNFAYLGARDSSPWVHHIGDERVGSGY
ncbi:glycosyltransferase [Gemmatimonas sp.]|uniref:glycosyltransferase n=1 Tax=Gemmatimonas sp. TaxID=1962908 RepID=UPI003562B920